MSSWPAFTRRQWTVGVSVAVPALVVMLMGSRFGPWRSRPEAPRPAGETTAPVRDLAIALPVHDWPLIGDSRHGARLFAMHCASCHGLDGRGNGPSAELLWPTPRDLTDPLALGSRSDAELVKLVKEGGPALGLSRNMPPFGDLVDELSAWDVVAFVRTLQTPRRELIGDAKSAAWTTVILEDAAAGAIAVETGQPTAPAERRVGLLLLPDGAAAAATAVEVGGRRFVVSVVVDAGGLPRASHVYPKVDPAAQPPELETAAARAGVLAAAAMQQRVRDHAAAADLQRRFRSAPGRFDVGQRAFLENCAACHGPNGRVVGPDLSTGNFRPRNLADQPRMAAVSDARLRRLIREGGRPLGVSGSMPSFDLAGAELDALVAFVRTLVVPVRQEDS